MSDLKVTIGADGSELSKEIKKIGSEVEKLDDKTAKGLNKLGKALGSTVPKAAKQVATAVEGAAASVGTLTASAKKLDDALEDVTPSAKAAGDALKGLGGAAGKGVGEGVKKTGADVDGLADQLGKKLPKASNEAGFALTNLGRVAQDAPFGFMGIQNNLNPLLESFQRLKTETGSTGGALKALGSSLMGAGGLGLALSLASGALLIYQQWQQKAKKATEESTGSIDANAKAAKALADGAGKEIAKMSLLYDATQNQNLSLDARRKIVDELQKQYPSYFGNLKDEAILAGKAGSAYRTLTQDIINSAIVRGGEDMIAKEAAKLAELNISLAKAANSAQTYATTQKTVNEETTQSETGFRKAATSIKETAGALKNLGEAQKGLMRSGSGGFLIDEKGDLQGITDYKTKLTDGIKSTKKAVQDLISGFNVSSILGNFSDAVDDKKGEKKKTPADILRQLGYDLKAIQVSGLAAGDSFATGFEQSIGANKKAISGLLDLGVSGDSPMIAKLAGDIQKLTPLTDGLTVKFAETASQIKNSVGDINAQNLVPFEAGLAGIASRMPQYVSVLKGTLDRFNEDVKNIVDNGLVDAFAGMGDAISQSLLNGTSIVQGLGASLLGALGSVLGQLGQMAIATGIAILGIKTALKTLNPIAAIAGGVALLALSGVVKGAAASIGNSMSGGGAGSPSSDSNPAGSASFSASGATGSGFSGTVVFEIAGTKLLGVLQNTTGRNLRIG